jgi:hypothetical protein
MRARRGREWEPEKRVTASPDGETNPAAVYDRDGRLWVAFERRGVNWGKDVGGQTLGIMSVGTRLGDTRALTVLVLDNGKWMEPATQPSDAMFEGEREALQAPRLYCDSNGRVWLLFRHKVRVPGNFARIWPVQTDQTPEAIDYRAFCQTYATFYEGERWAPATQMPNSRDRISSTMAAAPAPNGQFWIFWHTDNRDDNEPHVPRQNQVWSCVLTPMEAVPPAHLVERKPPPGGAAVPAGHKDEPGDVRLLRSHTVTIADRSYRIYRGESAPPHGVLGRQRRLYRWLGARFLSLHDRRRGHGLRRRHGP